MAPREFTVRITPEGRIIFDMTGMTQEEIRLTRAMVEETLGKIVAEGAPTEPPSPGRVWARPGAEEGEGRARERG